MLLIERSRWAPRRRVSDGAPESMHAASIPHELSPPASLTSKLVRMPECRRSENRHYIWISENFPPRKQQYLYRDTPSATGRDPEGLFWCTHAARPDPAAFSWRTVYRPRGGAGGGSGGGGGGGIGGSIAGSIGGSIADHGTWRLARCGHGPRPRLRPAR